MWEGGGAPPRTRESEERLAAMTGGSLLECPKSEDGTREPSDTESDVRHVSEVTASESDTEGAQRLAPPIEQHVLHRAAEACAFEDSEARRTDIQQFYDDLSLLDGPAMAEQLLSRASAVVRRCRSAANESRRRRGRLARSVSCVLQHTGPGGANTVALDQELDRIGYADMTGSRLEEGLPIAVELPNTGLWEATRSKAPERTIDQLREVGSDVAALQKRCAAAIEDVVAAEIWRQTKSEIGTRLSKPVPFDWGSAATVHKVLTFRFGIEQISSKGAV